MNAEFFTILRVLSRIDRIASTIEHHCIVANLTGNEGALGMASPWRIGVGCFADSRQLAK
jgi:hypothetical protein